VGGVTTIPSSSNPLRSYYNNFWQAGITGPGATTLPGTFSSSSLGGFGQPLYGTTGTAIASVAGLGGAQPSGAGFTSIGVPKTLPYITALSPDFPRPRRSTRQLRQQLRAVLSGSSALQNGAGIRLAVKNSRVTLRGQVPDARVRRLAEALIRMTPGVQDVQNNLQVGTGTRVSRRF
jgi:hypothetical protein